MPYLPLCFSTLITSAILYGRHHGPVTEDMALEPRDEYEQTQSELESIVLEDPLPGLPSVTVIRPASVYGPGCMASMACLAARASPLRNSVSATSCS